MKITFNIATLNEERRIEKCLQSIRNQSFPQKDIEIIIMDGGSTDQTLNLAKKYNVHVYNNERKLAEPGLSQGYKLAHGDYVVFMAADNILYDCHWLRKMTKPFFDDPNNIQASFCRIINDPNDNPWSQYLNEDTDPFNAFVFANASYAEKFSKIYPVESKKNGYIIYKYSIIDYPLIALAQGTILKKGLQRKEDEEYDDILPLINIIKSNKKIAYINSTGIRHYSLSGFSDFCRKFNKRIYNSMCTNSFFSREKYATSERKIRRYLFILYSLSLVLPVFDALINLWKKRKIHTFIHPLACLIITYYIFVNYFKTKIVTS